VSTSKSFILMVSNCSHNAGVEPYDSVCYKNREKGEVECDNEG
jgi:hypothetical protein